MWVTCSMCFLLAPTLCQVVEFGFLRFFFILTSSHPSLKEGMTESWSPLPHASGLWSPTLKDSRPGRGTAERALGWGCRSHTLHQSTAVCLNPSTQWVSIFAERILLPKNVWNLCTTFFFLFKNHSHLKQCKENPERKHYLVNCHSCFVF